MRRTIGFLAGLLALAAVVSACGKRVRVTGPHELVGDASYYAEPYHGRPTANGEIFDKNKMTAAHRTLPFNTEVRVTNKRNGRSVEVRINDRGPFIEGRVIDLSYGAARKLDMVRAGVVPVEIKLLRSGQGKSGRRERELSRRLYAVQVAAFRDFKTAEALKEALSRKYPAVRIESVGGNPKLYRVRVGREELRRAEEFVRELRREKFDPILVQIE